MLAVQIKTPCSKHWLSLCLGDRWIYFLFLGWIYFYGLYFIERKGETEKHHLLFYLHMHSLVGSCMCPGWDEPAALV